jgi:hypothetical protein
MREMRVWIAAAALVTIAGCANGGDRLISPSTVPVATPTMPANCAVPAAPGQLSADVSGASVNLTWSVVGDATDYVVAVGETPAGETILTNTSEAHHWIERIAEGTHFARVHAHNWCGTSESSEIVAFTVSSGQ